MLRQAGPWHDQAKAALHWMARGFGYGITGADMRDAFEAALAASRVLRRSDDKQLVAEFRAMLAGPGAGQQSLAKILARELVG